MTLHSDLRPTGRPKTRDPALPSSVLKELETTTVFHVSTNCRDGWPFVQERRCERGCVLALSDTRLLVALGNTGRDEATAANVRAEGRCVLFLTDATRQRRLKVWGEARVVDRRDQPALISRLDNGRGVIERALLIDARAWTYSRPGFLTPRGTAPMLRSGLGEH